MNGKSYTTRSREAGLVVTRLTYYKGMCRWCSCDVSKLASQKKNIITHGKLFHYLIFIKSLQSCLLTIIMSYNVIQTESTYFLNTLIFTSKSILKKFWSLPKNIIIIVELGGKLSINK